MKKCPLLYLFLISLLLLTSFRSTDEAMVPYYVVFAGASTNFSALDSTAQKISAATAINYENTLVYDSKRGMIVPDTSSDEIYAGSYFPRRYAGERISIEMAWYYAGSTEPDSAAAKTMCIITGIYGEKKEAAASLAKVKKLVPDAYMKKIKLYQGCMH